MQNIIVEKYLKRENSYSFDMLNDTNIFTRPELVSIVVDEKSLAQNNFHLEAKFISPTPLNNPTLGVIFLDKLKQPIFGTNSRMQRSGYINKILSSGTITLKIPDIPLIPGTYTISLFLGDSLTDYAEYHEVLNIELNDDLIDSTKLPDFRSIGSVKVKNVEWHLSS